TQPILIRLKSDLLDLIEHALAGTLDQAAAEWDRRCALGVVIAAANYPDEPRKGDRIQGIPAAAADCRVFHAGTKLAGDALVTNGGRVLCGSALVDALLITRQLASEAVRYIPF